MYSRLLQYCHIIQSIADHPGARCIDDVMFLIIQLLS